MERFLLASSDGMKTKLFRNFHELEHVATSHNKDKRPSVGGTRPPATSTITPALVSSHPQSGFLLQQETPVLC